MKRILLVFLSAAVLPALIAGCLFDDNEGTKTLEHVETGKLDGLHRIEDPTIFRIQWLLPVDVTDEPKLRGTCTFTGYLGDSGTLYREDIELLYTNSAMGGTHEAAYLRANGVILSLDTTLHEPESFTHYRAEFDCEY
jgi:hypothetical protein